MSNTVEEPVIPLVETESPMPSESTEKPSDEKTDDLVTPGDALNARFAGKRA